MAAAGPCCGHGWKRPWGFRSLVPSLQQKATCLSPPKVGETIAQNPSPKPPKVGKIMTRNSLKTANSILHTIGVEVLLKARLIQTMCCLFSQGDPILIDMDKRRFWRLKACRVWEQGLLGVSHMISRSILVQDSGLAVRECAHLP